MKKPTRTQTVAQREKVLNRVDKKGAGYIFILDLYHPEGQRGADKLKHYEDVANAMAVYTNTNLSHCQYMSVLIPFVGGGHAIVAFATAENLVTSIELIYQRSRDFGDMFAIVICPPNTQIATLIAKLQDTAGSA
jgi:hypothetical protein